jgi:tetratricopeptide (TPR) repeat protein
VNVAGILAAAAAALVCLAVASAQSPELAGKAERGKQAMAEGNFALAAQLYAELAEAVPNNPGLLLNLGMAQHMGGQDKAAIPNLQAALKIDPNIFPANLFLGASYLRTGEISKALPPLTKAAALEPSYPDVRAMLGDALLEVGRPAEAVIHYRKLTELQPDAAGGWVGLVQSYETLAQQEFQKLEDSFPESAYLMALVGSVRVTQQQYSSAFYLYKQALERQPQLRGAHAALAEIYRRTDHADWAAVEEQKEGELPPPDCQAEKIECAWRDGRFDEALRLAKEAEQPQSGYWQVRVYNQLAGGSLNQLAALPSSPQRHQVMADLHSRNGRYIEAVEELRAALKLVPGNAALEGELALALYMGRDYQGAIDLSGKLLAQRPADPQLNWIRGGSLLALQKAEEAIQPLKKAVEANADLLPAHHALGRAYMQLGQDAAAVPHLKAALPIDEDGSLHYQLGQAYRTTGQMDLAKQTLTTYQQMQREMKAQQRELQEEIQITAP